VLTAADVDRAVDAGARFVVSPSVVPAVIAAAADRGIPSATWWSATCWPSGSARWSGATTRPPL
jgi:ABC-type sugar transport system substrate-binding protein